MDNKTEKPARKSPRRVRRMVAAPDPKALKAARQERLREALLDNSRAIHDALVVWDGEGELRVGLDIGEEFDGKLIAAHYRDAGWSSCKYEPGPHTDEDGKQSNSGCLLFEAEEAAQLGGIGEEPAPEPAKKAAAKKTAKRAAKKTAAKKTAEPPTE